MLEKKIVVKEVYEAMINSYDPDKEEFYNILWKLPVPSETKGLVWRLAHDRLQTKDNLHKRLILPPGFQVQCVMRMLNTFSLDVNLHLRCGLGAMYGSGTSGCCQQII